MILEIPIIHFQELFTEFVGTSLILYLFHVNKLFFRLFLAMLSEDIIYIKKKVLILIQA